MTPNREAAFYANAARVIRTARKLAGRSQASLAQSVGHATAWVSMLESGARRPSAYDLAVIARSLRIPRRLLFALPPHVRP